MIVLGIETSCDETSAAVLDGQYRVLSQRTFSQTTHSRFGGVVPEIASREHAVKIDAVVADALSEARCAAEDISLVAATCAPGLIGALLVGLSFAKGFAFAHNIPFVGVNHLDGHIQAAGLTCPDLTYPFVALVVSGGHTFLVHATMPGSYRLLGNTLDDAAGEAIDKAGKLFGIAYPAGREIEAIAKAGDPAFYRFPRALPGKDNLDFSFSGVKTALRNFLEKQGPSALQAQRADILAAYQEAVVEVLSKKSVRAMRLCGTDRLVVAGGVACNGRLRNALRALIPHEKKLYFPSPEYCTDNGAMIAAAGLTRFNMNGPDSLDLPASAVFNIKEVNYGASRSDNGRHGRRGRGNARHPGNA